MQYSEFRERIEKRFGERGPVSAFARFVGMGRVAVSRWGPYIPSWVGPLLDAWDEIDRLRDKSLPPDASPLDYQTLPHPDRLLPPPNRSEE